MKLCLAQYKSISGDIDQNIILHQRFINAAIEKSADLIIFPELSLSGYEPSLASDLALDPTDARLSIFQELSDNHNITICISVPTRSNDKPKISLLIFKPYQSVVVYSKRCLHGDEVDYFSAGDEAHIIECKGLRIFPSICYESMLDANTDEAHNLKADIYLATVAKDKGGILSGYPHYRSVAEKHSMTVAMCNSVGINDNFVSMGQSAFWNKDGQQMGQMNPTDTGILVLDYDKSSVEEILISSINI